MHRVPRRRSGREEINSLLERGNFITSLIVCRRGAVNDSAAYAHGFVMAIHHNPSTADGIPPFVEHLSRQYRIWCQPQNKILRIELGSRHDRGRKLLVL